MKSPAPSFLQFDVQGKGEPIVLVHGWCCHRGHMAALADVLAKTHQVYNLDLPGHGQTPPIEGAPTYAAYVACLVDFIAEQDLRGVAMIGHSLGGVFSILAAGGSDRIAAVVNLDGLLPLTSLTRDILRNFAEQLQQGPFRSTMRAHLRTALFLPTEHGAAMEAIIADMMAMPEDLAKNLFVQLTNLDGAVALTNCRAPLLYVTGSWPLDDEPIIRALCPGTSFARVEPSGHFVQVFALPQVVAECRRFLGSLRSA